jgi:hypothetical protein
MAEVGPPEPDFWEELRKLLETEDDVSSPAGTKSVMCLEAASDKVEQHSVLLTDNAPVLDPAPDSCEELLKFLQCIGLKIRFVDGLSDFENIHNSLQENSNLDPTRNISRVDPNKALLNIEFEADMPKGPFLMKAKVLAKIGFILLHIYGQDQDALRFCEEAHLYFKHVQSLSKELKVEQAKNCAMAGVICRRIKQYSSVEEWDERAIQILKSCLPITTPEKNALRNYAIEYNDDATSYFGAGDTENATSCWKMAREIFRAIDYSKGVDIVSWHLETFGTKKSKKPTL